MRRGVHALVGDLTLPDEQLRVRDVIARGVFTSVPDLKLMRHICQCNKAPKTAKRNTPTRRDTSGRNQLI